MELVVNLEVATASVNGWLDHKKIKAKKREASKAFIDTMIDAVSTGNLVVEDDFRLTMNLDFPIKGEVSEISTITFVPRITDINKEPYRRSVKTDTFEGQMMLTLCALTKQPIGVLKSLDEGTDKSLAEAIALFFM